MVDQIPENLKLAITKYLAGEATPGEIELVYKWYHSFDDSDIEIESDIPDLEDRIDERLRLRLDLVNIDTPDSYSFISRNKMLIKIAAIILLMLSTGLYFVSTINKDVPVLGNINDINKGFDILPGKNKAFLTLENGLKIALDQIKIGEMIRQGNVSITKASDGQVVYRSISPFSEPVNKITYNTISIPRGGKYQVELPDGSLVWLNASSSLTYPTVFTGNERKVKLEGEAYFEIAHNKAMPFKVEAKHQTVEVLGTHFNVNSYVNEPVTKTTLLQGKIRISSQSNTAAEVLNPGQEASMSVNGSLKITQANALEAVSWKNGEFMFNDASLDNILRQLERWYDIDVDYSNIPKTHYNGTISQNVKLSQVLQMLELTSSVKFQIEGKSLKIKY